MYTRTTSRFDRGGYSGSTGDGYEEFRYLSSDFIQWTSHRSTRWGIIPTDTLTKMWWSFFSTTLPYFEAVFLPINSFPDLGIDIRKKVLIGYRDYVILPLYPRLECTLPHSTILTIAIFSIVQPEMQTKVRPILISYSSNRSKTPQPAFSNVSPSWPPHWQKTKTRNVWTIYYGCWKGHG